LTHKLKDCIRQHINLQTKELDDIISFFQPKDLESGELFSEPGKKCRQMAFIHTGVLRMYNINEKKEVTLWIGSENSFITDLSSFINQLPLVYRSGTSLPFTGYIKRKSFCITKTKPGMARI